MALVVLIFSEDFDLASMCKPIVCRRDFGLALTAIRYVEPLKGDLFGRDQRGHCANTSFGSFWFFPYLGDKAFMILNYTLKFEGK